MNKDRIHEVLYLCRLLSQTFEHDVTILTPLDATEFDIKILNIAVFHKAELSAAKLTVANLLRSFYRICLNLEDYGNVQDQAWHYFQLKPPIQIFPQVTRLTVYTCTLSQWVQAVHCARQEENMRTATSYNIDLQMPLLQCWPRRMMRSRTMKMKKMPFV